MNWPGRSHAPGRPALFLGLGECLGSGQAQQCSVRVPIPSRNSEGRRKGFRRFRLQSVSVSASASVSRSAQAQALKGRRNPPWVRLLLPLLLPLSRQATPTRKTQPLLELAASTSKLEKAGPARGATAGDGEGDEIGIDPPPETPEQRNKFLVLRLYEALNARDHAAVQALLAPDLEWWFHGPPKHQHMMRLLTGGGGSGSGSGSGFRFVPRSVDALGGSTVIAEGQEGGVYWVHAWTVGPDGVITQLREYLNTDLTVTRLAAAKCVWQSRRPDSATNSLPGLLLAL